MSIEQKYILGFGGETVIHFAKAADGTESVELAPITESSVESLMTFTSAAEAGGYKDKLCRMAAAQELPQGTRGQTFTPYSLETYCALNVQPLGRTLEAV